jgi:hypothetical protein
VGVMAVLHTCGSNLSYHLHEGLANKIPDIPEYDVSTCFHEFLTGMPKKSNQKSEIDQLTTCLLRKTEPCPG